MTSVSLDYTTTTIVVEDPLDRVCEMNNAAVELLVDGRLDAALVLLTRASAATKLLLEEDDSYHPGTPGIAESSLRDSMFETTISEVCRASKDAGKKHVASPEDGAFVYHRVFKLRYADTRGSFTPPLRNVCTIILYNMGIGFHLHGIVNCSQLGLKRAATVYGLTLSSCMNETTTNGTIFAVPPIIRLAILNNLGEIYYRLCHYGEMALVYDHMKNLNCYAHMGILVGGPFLDQVEIGGLIWNFMFLKRPVTAAAA